MNETDIRKYAELMKELGLTGLEITEDNSKVRLERSVTVQPKETVYSVPETNTVSQITAVENNDYISVKSPIVGVFYAAPAENADPYVVAGDSVKKGQTLCIVEAMKLMNEIVAEQDGTVVDVCAHNGDVVEYGQTLFKLS